MGNHYHLLLSEVHKEGMPKFLKKLNMGYAKYFNTKYKRSGALFQGKTKRVPILTERQYLYILPYIHLNPLDLHKTFGAWRTQSLSDSKSALSYLTSYRWSSYRNYVGVTDQAEILEGSNLFSDKQTFVKDMRHVLTSMHDGDLADTRLE
jgi:putative transposase